MLCSKIEYFFILPWLEKQNQYLTTKSRVTSLEQLSLAEFSGE
jgi:hypothetical protein